MTPTKPVENTPPGAGSRPGGVAAAPRHVLLFSGHLVDAPGRSRPRFPPAKVAAATTRIGAALDALDAGPADLGLTQGAAGGDLIFSEACLARGVPLRWLLPLPEADFVAQSVLASADGEAWRTRFLAARERLAAPPRIAADELGPAPPGVDVWERGNLWLLDAALAFGAHRLRAIVLWDGGGGDGRGGTLHMVEEVRRRGGRVFHIDTGSL